MQIEQLDERGHVLIRSWEGGVYSEINGTEGYFWNERVFNNFNFFNELCFRLLVFKNGGVYK